MYLKLSLGNDEVIGKIYGGYGCVRSDLGSVKDNYNIRKEVRIWKDKILEILFIWIWKLLRIMVVIVLEWLLLI